MPAEPPAQRPPFIPPELLARRPQPHFPPFVRPGDPTTQSHPVTQGQPVQTGQYAAPVQTGQYAAPVQTGQYASPVPTGQGPIVSPTGNGQRPGDQNRRLALIIGTALVAVVIIVVAGLVWHRQADGGSTAAAKQPPAAAAEVKPQVSSYSPQGTGFRSKGGTWTTQTYKDNPKFGGLKAGAGLVLDLGSARAVSLVEFDAGTGPLTVQLRAGDDASNAAGYDNIGDSVPASGQTKLTVPDAAKPHRYWMIWVTELGPKDGGYAGVISDIAVHAR